MSGPKRRVVGRIGLWPVYLILFYPYWWLGQAAANALPAVLACLGTGADLSRGRVDWSGAFARAGRAPNGAIPDADLWTAATALLLVGVLVGVGLRLRHWRPPALYAAALLAWAGLARGVTRVFVRGEPSPAAGALLLGTFLALAFCLDRLPVGLLRQTFLGRLRGLAAAFLAPLVAWTLFVAALAPFSRTSSWAPLGAAAAAVLLASRRRSWEPEPESHAWVWRAGASGAVGTFVVLLATPHVSVALESLRGDRDAVALERIDAAPLPHIERDFFFKGVNFTAEWPDPYGSAMSHTVLEGLKERGVNAIALVPYAAQRAEDAELRFPLRMERDELVAASATKARSLGLRVLLKPQVWVRGGGLYPGDLAYPDPERRAQWFASYCRYIERQAALARQIHADMFCVGVEFAQLSQYEAEWRRIIAAVRRIYGGPLVYAANFGAEFESVRFWDALDYIGLDNYYPLPEDLSTDEIEQRIEAVYRRYGKPVLFTEAGFSTYQQAYEKPWEDEPGGPYSPQAQARYVEALLDGFYDEPWLHGVFWWKVGTAGLVDPRDDSHQLWGKPAMEVIERYYARDPGRPREASVDSE